MQVQPIVMVNDISCGEGTKLNRLIEKGFVVAISGFELSLFQNCRSFNFSVGCVNGEVAFIVLVESHENDTKFQGHCRFTYIDHC